jgi:signal peptidase I
VSIAPLTRLRTRVGVVAGPGSMAPDLEAMLRASTSVPRWTRLRDEAAERELALDRPSLAVLLSVDGCSDVAALAAKHGLIRTLQALARLHELDLITFDAATAEDAPAEKQASTDGALDDGSATGRVRRFGLRRVVLATWLTALAALLAVLWLSGPLGKDILFVKGSSMAPLLRPGQLLVLNRGAYGTPGLAGPRRGDIVIFRHEMEGDQEYLVKRVIGLPGDLVRIDAGRVFINGSLLQEPYVRATDDYSYPLQGGSVRVPDGAYFVLGDNRPESADSHLGWFVPATDVLGEAWALPVALPALPMPTRA